MTSDNPAPKPQAMDATTINPLQSVEQIEAGQVPALTIVYHPDLARVGERALLAPGTDGRARVSRLHPLFVHRGGANKGTPLAEPHLSRKPAFIEYERGGNVALSAPTGPTKLLVEGEPLTERCEFGDEELERGVLLDLAGHVLLLLHRVNLIAWTGDSDGIVGESFAISTVRRQIYRVAKHEVPVLLRGESGTGKELIAKAVHARSQRAEGPLVSVNMAAVPSSTAASALFGHAKGAFTGAVQASSGYFGRADGGTLFLDEVGDTPAEVQPALLRALDSGEVQAVGETRTRVTDVRVIAATDANLEKAVERGQFRLPLLQRLAGYELFVPPLRERREDIPRLFVHFLRAKLKEIDHAERLAPPDRRSKPWLPIWLMAAAVQHHWPGNVRQLRNMAHQLAIEFADEPEVKRSPFVSRLLASEGEGGEGGDTIPPAMESSPAKKPKKKRRLLRDISDEEVMEALRRHNFQPGRAAEELGVARSSMYALVNESPTLRKAADLTREQVTAQLAAVDGDVAAAANALEVSERGLRLRLKQLGID